MSGPSMVRERPLGGEPFSVRTFRQQQALMRLLAVGDRPLEQRVQLVLRLAADALAVERASYWKFLEDNSRLRCESLYLRSGERYEAGDELLATSAPGLFEALQSGTPLVAEGGLVDDERFRGGHWQAAGIGALLAVPIYARRNLFGAVFVEHVGDARRWEVDEQNFAISVAQLLSLASKSHRLERAEDALRESEARFRAMVEASPVPMVVVTAPEGVCLYGNLAAAEALGLLPEDLPGKCTADFYWKEEERAVVLAEFRRGGKLIGRDLRFKRDDGTLRWFNVSAQKLDFGEQAAAVVGFIDVSEHKRLEYALRHMALHDGLTGLPNRALFHDMLGRELAHARRTADYLFAVLFIDLDNFKEVNDSFGHAAGDKLLVKLADRVKHCLRPKDLFARMGGDEFTILLSDVNGNDEVVGVAERVKSVLSEPQHVAGHAVEISGSIGVVLDRPSYKTVDQIMRAADKAMYRAKAEGRNRYVIFDGKAISPRRTSEQLVVLKKNG